MSRSAKIVIVVSLSLAAIAWCVLAAIEDRVSEAKFNLIEDGLYLGQWVRVPPPGTSAVANVCGYEDPYQLDASLSAPVLEGGREATVEWLAEVVDFIAAQRRLGRTVYVHCIVGVNRSPTAVAAYLMSEHGCSRETAVAHVCAKRPKAGPDPEMIRLLDRWGETLAAKSP